MLEGVGGFKAGSQCRVWQSEGTKVTSHAESDDAIVETVWRQSEYDSQGLTVAGVGRNTVRAVYPGSLHGDLAEGVGDQ